MDRASICPVTISPQTFFVFVDNGGGQSSVHREGGVRGSDSRGGGARGRGTSGGGREFY